MYREWIDIETRVRFPSPAPAFAKATAGRPISVIGCKPAIAVALAKAARRSLGEGGPNRRAPETPGTSRS